jgi:hypothetical protein
MDDRHQARSSSADQALAEYDFDPNMTIDADSWNTEDDRNNEWTCVLSMEDDDRHSYRCGFIVRFEPGMATVIEAFVGDRH